MRKPRPAARPTVETVAQRAGVSRQTVSNAINAPNRVQANTLHKVLVAIDELGYRPNHAARTLRTQATRLLACRLLPASANGSGAVLDRFLHALCESARGRGYDILSFAAGSDDEEIEVLQDLLRRTAVDGVVLSGTHFVDPRPEWLIRRGASSVAFGRAWGVREAQHSWVDVDGAAGIEAAVDHLADRGHRRIGFLGWPKGSGSGDDRYEGWHRCVARRGLPMRGLVGRAQNGTAAGSTLASKLLDCGAPPTAFVCVSDVMALGAMRAMDDRNLDIGRDVAIAGFDDGPVTTMVRPGLTSVRQPLEAVAATLVELLLEQLAGLRAAPVHILLAPSLVIRDSSAIPLAIG